VCYGPGPDAAAIARIRARGLGVYAENDARIDAGLADVAAAVKQYAKDYRYTVYPGVGHGFLRSRERPEVADSAWGNVVRFFKESLERLNSSHVATSYAGFCLKKKRTPATSPRAWVRKESARECWAWVKRTG